MKKLEKMLWEGVEENDLRKVALALNLGADVNSKDDDDGMSLLHYTAYRDKIAIAELLISAGADVDSKDKASWSPLHWAVAMDNVALAELLISAGAYVDAKTNLSKSPLYYAKSKEMKELLQGVMT